MDRLPISSADAADQPPRRARLNAPVGLPEGMACDAVGILEEHGRRLLSCLPRAGAVFALGACWWWVVPPESQVGLAWPPSTRYWARACLPRCIGKGCLRCSHRPVPRLVHLPEDDTPYTHPLLLYVAVCRLTGVPPVS